MITTSTGAKKIEDSDNWRLIFEAHNDSVDAHDDAIANIATVISGTTNNSGHAISVGEYFIANGAKYKASATIDTGATWSDKSTSVSDHDLINALNGKLTQFITTKEYTVESGFTSNSSGDETWWEATISISADKQLYGNPIGVFALARYYVPCIVELKATSTEVHVLMRKDTNPVTDGIYAKVTVIFAKSTVNV